MFEYPLFMRDVNANYPYFPFPLVLRQAESTNEGLFVGVNVDESGQSGSTLAQSTWWRAYSVLLATWGMVRAKRAGFTNERVETLLYDWLRLQPGGYLWHSRYNPYGTPLPNDTSQYIALTALYGICLKEGYQPSQPPPRIGYLVSQGGVIEVVTDKRSVVPVVRLPNGNIVQHTAVSPSNTTKGFKYRYEVPSNLLYVTVDEKYVGIS